MSKKLALLQLATMMAIAGNSEYSKEFQETPKKRTMPTKDEIAENKGLKKFFYGDKYVYAINKKNADRKAKNLGYF